MLFCSVFWRRVTWTGSVWMRRPGRPLQTPTTRTAPSRPLANGKGAGAQPAERPPDPALVLIFSLPHRPSARFPHQRRKKRREMDDGLAEGGPQRSNAYVIKLFDRSVDLAQFSENTPLYPICRAWMRNSPSVRERERSPSSPLPPLPEDEELLGHLETPADPEFHPRSSLRPRVPLMTSPPSLSPHPPLSSTETCSAGNASARGGRRHPIGTSFVTRKA
ncbi:protein lin-37 homolog isoform X2 [Sus scrofa]|uniref:protein lin-37 homolog isoform X2 n=1 Tax=Sus scrofa TaxID=9823 RepID=UPI0006B1AFC3|nr:protein lin-37 homolog isoform X2 [Sus scrofa]